LAAKDKLLDELGINQHHDAVSGTAKQNVANDYALRLFKGMKQNNIQYGKVIQDNIEAETGMTTNSEWNLCQRTNSTFLDCPVSNYANEENYTMYVAVHNPSANQMSQASVAVPNGNYKAQVFNKDTQEFEDVAATVLCSDDDLENGKTLKSCFLHADFVTHGKEVSLLALTQDSSVDLEAKS
jgi:hypothetical protein